MKTIQTYAVYKSTDDLADAQTGLTAHDVVRHIYQYVDGDYQLVPKMLCDRHDEEGNGLPDIQDTTPDGDLVFEVWFKDSGSFPWQECCIAIGKNKADAEAAFLQESFDGTMWSKSFWIVLTTEQYLAELAQQVRNLTIRKIYEQGL